MKTLSLRRNHALALPLCLVALMLPAAGCRDDGGGAPGGSEGSGTAGPDTEGTGGTADGTATEGDTEGGEINVIPPPGGMRRLTPEQYVSSVTLIFGAAAGDVADPPPLPALGTFDSQTAAQEPLTPVDIEAYETSSRSIGTVVSNDPAGLTAMVPCVATEDASCYDTLARDLGRFVWRRPLIEDEVTTLVAIAEAGQEWANGDFYEGIKYQISAMLQSPNFLYVQEVGEPTGEADLRELRQYELASRLSFFLLGHTPDLALLDAAEGGGLETDEQVQALAVEMLDRPEARQRLAEFYDELYRLRDLATKGKDDVLFPTFSPTLAAAMRQETQLLIENVVFEEEGNFLDIFDANYTFVNDELAQVYNMPPPAFPWQLVPLPAEQSRAGFLSHPGFLTVFSHPDVNSPTRRGLFVQEHLLCTDIQPPPADANPMPPSPVEGQTIREWLESVHNADPSCATCHNLMDPVGFAFERYDPIGAFRQLDNGLPIDSTGDVAGLGSFGNAAELAGLLRNDPRVPNCVVRNLYRSTLGYDEGLDQAEGIAALDEAFSESEFNYKTLMVELTVNPLFRLVDAPK